MQTALYHHFQGDKCLLQIYYLNESRSDWAPTITEKASSISSVVTELMRFFRSVRIRAAPGLWLASIRS